MAEDPEFAAAEQKLLHAEVKLKKMERLATAWMEESRLGNPFGKDGWCDARRHCAIEVREVLGI
jgi:hypothetical protein